jgi:RNA polymerase sigma-70 factor (ECF subfamily)
LPENFYQVMTGQHEDTGDKELLDAIAQQDVRTFNILYGRYNRLLYAKVLGRLKNPGQAREIMQGLWISIWERPAFVKTNETGAAKGFLYHYLAYRVLDFIRKEKFHAIAIATREPLEAVEETLSYVHVAEEYELHEFEARVASIIDGLPDQTAEIFTLHWRQGYSLKEVANLLQLDERSVRQKSKESIDVLKRLIGSG